MKDEIVLSDNFNHVCSAVFDQDAPLRNVGEKVIAGNSKCKRAVRAGGRIVAIKKLLIKNYKSIDYTV